MYFQSDLHEQNYQDLMNRVFIHADKDSEYHSVAYIFALPEIYTRCINDPLLREYPFLWSVKYIDNSKMVQDGDDEYIEVDLDIEEDETGGEVRSKQYGTLSHGHKLMVDLAKNLFNGSSKINVTDAISTWDDTMLKVFFQALKVRFPISLKFDY